MIEFDLANFEPKANNWLETNHRYDGNGVAKFASPVGIVSGTFTAMFDEFGNHSIETEYDSISCDPEYESNHIAFLFGAERQVLDGATTWSIGTPNNHCENLSITTEHGEYVSTGHVRVVGVNFGTQPTRVRFSVRQGKFETLNPQLPKYFVIPLFNFVAEVNSERLFGHHPLRIFPTPFVPDDLPQTEKLAATLRANRRNSVTGLKIGDSQCFIECLPDYDTRFAELKGGAQRRLTAVLVGEVGQNAVSTIADFVSWFPFEVLSALSFVSGTEVGWPWVEIRDSDGGLIRRLHGHAQVPTFHEGDALLDKFDRPGTGRFLTQYLSLPPERRSYLGVAMNHARLGSLGSHLRLYDILDHLIRALECLCREHGFVQQNLLGSLGTRTQERVKEITSQATTCIKQLIVEAQKTRNMNEYRVLATIQSRAANMGTTEKKFGLAVVDLIKHFALHDADIIDRSFAARPRADRLPDWATVITNYRNATIHEGYMDFEKKHDGSDVVRICRHLKDIITRIIFKECGYSGTYESVLRSGYGPQSIDWVTIDSESCVLGFQ